MRGLGFAPLYGCIAYAFTAVEFVVILLDKVCKTMLIGRKRSGFRFFFFLLHLRFFAFEKWRMWMPFRNFIFGFAECGLGNDVC